MNDDEPIDYDLIDDVCDICGAFLDVESCWQCGGRGGHHDCGEDCCCCRYPDDNVTCEECEGRGWYRVCTALPHTEEQMARANPNRAKAQ